METLSKSAKLVIIGLIIISGFLGIMLFRGCSSTTNVERERDSLKVLTANLQKQHDEDQKITEAQQKRIDTIDTKINEITKQSSDLRKKLNVSEGKVSSLTNQVRMAKQDKDTFEFYVSCDSLAEVADSVIALEKFERAKSDTTIVLYKQKSQAQDSIIARKTALYNSTYISLAGTIQKYDNMLGDYQKLQKKYKRERTLTRIVSGVGLALVGALILK